MRKIIACAFILAAIGVVLAGNAYGQTGTSRITGTILDSSGAVVPGASVSARNEATGVTYTQLTTGAGLYAFPSLPVGSYTIKVEMSGFKTAEQTGVILTVGTPISINITLQVGGVTEVVSVTGGYELLQTSTATIGNVVDQKTIAQLPLNGRNPLTLITMEPGVVQRSYGGAGSGLHVNGSRDRAFNVTIDGIEANESSVPNPISNLYRLNPDNVQEYKVTTNNATPEEGRNSGASVSVATRAGANEFHGTLFEFARNTALNSNEYFTNAIPNSKKPEIKMHQFGAEVSGPIFKNKTFFFGSWQGQNTKFTQPVEQTFGTVSMYTPSALNGIFRYFVADPKNPFTMGGVTITRNSPLLVDPVTGALKPGIRECTGSGDTNCIASFNMYVNDPRKIGADPVINKLFKSYPLPNNYATGDGLNFATYTWNPPTRNKGPHFMFRIDHTINEKHSIFGRYIHATQDTREGDPLNGRPQVLPGFPPLGEVERRTKNLAINWRWVISPRIVNEYTMGFARFVFLFTQGEANPTWPNVVPYSFNLASIPYNNNPRTFRAVTTPQFLDNFSIIRGAHVFRIGFNMRFYQHNDQRGQPGGTQVTPVLSFSYTVRPPAGFNLPAVGTGGIDATDSNNLQGSINDLLGIPARLSQGYIGDLNQDMFMPFLTGDKVTLWAEGHRLKQYNFYFQDEWKIKPNLTLNYGARWEINMAPTEAGGRVYKPDKLLTSGLPVTFKKADAWLNSNNIGAIGPRIGIVWGLNQKTVIRTGYGIAFDTISSFQVTAAAGRVPGLSTSCSSTVGGTTTPGCTVVPDLRIAEGFPTQLGVPSLKPSSYLTPPLQTLSNAPVFIQIDPDLQIPTVHQWNLSIQRELPQGFVAQVGYIGRRGTRLFRAYDLNQISADKILPSFLIMQQNRNAGCRPDGTNCPTGVTGQQVPIVVQGIVSSSFVNSSTTASDLTLNGAGNFAGRVEQTTLAAGLRLNQQFGTITYLDSGGDSYYHSMQATVRKRFERGLQMGLSYTFGKSIDDQSVDPVGASSGGGLSTSNSRTPYDTRNWRGERARSDFDKTHTVSFNGIWDMPVGKGRRFGANFDGIPNQVLGGWSLNWIYTYMSGEPWTVRSGVRTSNYSHESRADLVGAKPQARLQSKPGTYGPVLFLDATAFKVPAPGTNGFGRNTFAGPSYHNLDLGIQKLFRITERISFQLRAEMFNALNHPNFDHPFNSTNGSASIRSTAFGVTGNQTVAPPTTQTIIQTGESARIIQFAAKIVF